MFSNIRGCEIKLHVNPSFMERFVELTQPKRGDCKTDHGERTNRKLRDQPFFQRGRNGKMKPY